MFRKKDRTKKKKHDTENNKKLTDYPEFKMTSVRAEVKNEGGSKLKQKKRNHLAMHSSLYEFITMPTQGTPKRQKINHLLDEEHKKEAKAPIVIPYRDDGRGKGAYHDHYTAQLMTGTPTVISTTNEKPIAELTEYLRTVTYNLSYGEDRDGRNIPPIVQEIEQNLGLLLIPGVARNTLEKRSNNYEIRRTHEEKLLTQAQNKGQPILGICGGSWAVWEFFGGQVKEVEDHNCGSGMPRIKDTTGKIGHNMQIHRIKLSTGASFLKSALKLAPDSKEHLPVNSVHWQAPDDSKIPAQLMVSARAVQDQSLPPKSRQGTIMEPEEDTVEAFESKHGAPILGIQWHPAAYTSNTKKEYCPSNQQHLLNYMVKAGQTYRNRENLVRQFKYAVTAERNGIHISGKALKQTSLFSWRTEVLRRITKDKQVEFFRFSLKESSQLRHVKEMEQEIRCKEDYFLEKADRMAEHKRMTQEVKKR